MSKEKMHKLTIMATSEAEATEIAKKTKGVVHALETKLSDKKVFEVITITNEEFNK